MEISESALFRLGRTISGCLVILSDALEYGVDRGDSTVEEPQLLANTLRQRSWRPPARPGRHPGQGGRARDPTVGTNSADQVRDYPVATALALATADA